MAEERTTQLRRYRIVPGEMDAFVSWWRTRPVPAREDFGYVVEWAAVVPRTDEFVWAVSAPGGSGAFEKLDAAWAISEERRQAFAGVPQRVAAMDLELALLPI